MLEYILQFFPNSGFITTLAKHSRGVVLTKALANEGPKDFNFKL